MPFIFIYVFLKNLQKIFHLQTGAPYHLQKANTTKSHCNPLSANPTKWSNKLKQSVGKLPTNQIADELFECVWPFCEIGAKRAKRQIQNPDKRLRSSYLREIVNVKHFRKKLEFGCLTWL